MFLYKIKLSKPGCAGHEWKVVANSIEEALSRGFKHAQEVDENMEVNSIVKDLEIDDVVPLVE